MLLYCPRTLAAGEEDSLASLLRQPSNVDVRAEKIACGGSVQVPHLMKILEEGADAVQLVTCTDTECQSLTGSSRAAKRIDYACRLLSGFGLGAERLGIYQGSDLRAAELRDLSWERARATEPLGRHPMKTKMSEIVA